MSQATEAKGGVDALVALIPTIDKQLSHYRRLTREDREDLRQATLIRAIDNMDSFRGDSRFSTWLFRVTANEALMMMRSRRRRHLAYMRTLHMPVPDVKTPEVDVSVRQLRDAVAALSESDRDVITAHYVMSLGLEEIANRLRVTKAAVQSRLHRARSRLRRLLVTSAA